MHDPTVCAVCAAADFSEGLQVLTEQTTVQNSFGHSDLDIGSETGRQVVFLDWTILFQCFSFHFHV